MLNLRRDYTTIFYIGDKVYIRGTEKFKIDKTATIIENNWENRQTHSNKYKVDFNNGFVGWFLPEEMEKL